MTAGEIFEKRKWRYGEGSRRAYRMLGRVAARGKLRMTCNVAVIL